MPERPRVFVTRTLPGVDAHSRLDAATDVDSWALERPPTHAELREHAAGAAALLTMLTERVDGALLDASPRVRVVANMAAGYDNIDVAAASERGVLVTNTPDAVTEPTADLAFALLLAVARRVPEGEDAVRRGEWGPWHPGWLLGRDIHGATLGIVGPGRIGTAVARRAQGFAMTVLYHGRRRIEDFPGERVSFDHLLERSDFVSVHLPLNAETEHMFDARAFGRMQPHAIFVNTARGGVIDQGALRDALVERRIAGAALDVTTPEPLSADDPLLRAPNLLVTPHLGSATEQARNLMAIMAVNGLLAGLAGERPQHLVNPQAWEQRRT